MWNTGNDHFRSTFPFNIVNITMPIQYKTQSLSFAMKNMHLMLHFITGKNGQRYQ